MIIKGVARFNKDKKKHIITTQTVSYTVLAMQFDDMHHCFLGAQMCVGLLQKTWRRRIRHYIPASPIEWSYRPEDL